MSTDARRFDSRHSPFVDRLLRANAFADLSVSEHRIVAAYLENAWAKRNQTAIDKEWKITMRNASIAEHDRALEAMQTFIHRSMH